MSSEIKSLKQRITELEAENTELRKENTEIPYLRNKLSVSDAEIAELKRRNIEFLRANKEYNERRDAKVNKLEQKNKELETRLVIVEQASLPVEQRQMLNDNTPNNNTPNDNTSNNNSSNFNSGVDQVSIGPHREKSLEDKEMNAFLVDENKKSVGDDIRRRNKEKKLKKAEQASLNQDQESGTCDPEARD